jgi:hypothetical protein
MAKKKTNEPVVEAAPEVIATEVNEPAGEPTEAPSPTPKPKNAKKPKAATADIVPVLALAGSLARKRTVPETAGTLPTHTPLFVLFLVATVLLVGALTFLPSLALGPIVEHLSLSAR